MAAIEITRREILSDWKYKLEKVEYLYAGNAGEVKKTQREVYHRGTATAILLVDPERQMVLLTSQFRLPVSLNGNVTGVLMECCAGMIDHDEIPEHCIIREVEEELGYRISEIQEIGSGYTSPAAMTEYMHLFIGRYSPDLKVSQGGGKEDEGEKITAVELTFTEAREKLISGKIQDLKTILLLQQAIITNMI